MKDPHTILITGASNGLGAALALAYAAPGKRLFLLARSAQRLHSVAKACQDKGAVVTLLPCDVTDAASLKNTLLQADAAAPLDLVIANAGISGGTSGGAEGEDQTNLIFQTNCAGVFHTILPVIPLFQRRKRGQIAIMSSLAGFRGMPGAPAYCASKAAVRVWGEALGADLAPCGITVSVICPGFVKTPMTDQNACPMPFLMSPEKAAARIKKGLAKGKPRISFPAPMAFLATLLALLPPALTTPLLARAPRK